VSEQSGIRDFGEELARLRLDLEAVTAERDALKHQLGADGLPDDWTTMLIERDEARQKLADVTAERDQSRKSLSITASVIDQQARDVTRWSGECAALRRSATELADKWQREADSYPGATVRPTTSDVIAADLRKLVQS